MLGDIPTPKSLYSQWEKIKQNLSILRENSLSRTSYSHITVRLTPKMLDSAAEIKTPAGYFPKFTQSEECKSQRGPFRASC